MFWKVPTYRKRAMRAKFVSCPGCGATTEQLKKRYPNMPIHMILTVEHLTPRSLGGNNDDCNLIIICYRCNSARGNIEPWDWHGSHHLIFANGYRPARRLQQKMGVK